MQNEEYYEVTNLMYDNSLRLIIDSNQEIRDGDEVYIRQDIFQVKSGLIDRE